MLRISDTTQVKVDEDANVFPLGRKQRLLHLTHFGFEAIRQPLRHAPQLREQVGAEQLEFPSEGRPKSRILCALV